MPLINRIAAFSEAMTGWRRHLHAHPEIDMACHATADFVAARLTEFGVDSVTQGIGQTGVVAMIEGRAPGPTVGLRADMDALPMEEDTGLAHASTRPDAMHACGHDGHTAMLLGAARYLAETRNFAGRVALVFQPGEEDSGGARFMIEDGLFETWDMEEIYALHSLPGVPVGSFHTAPGPILAAQDDWRIDLTGTGGHAASPHETADPVAMAAALHQALQTV
ncbi:MAG: amidohydrolase, partial [Pseudomonadota bacterium]